MHHVFNGCRRPYATHCPIQKWMGQRWRKPWKCKSCSQPTDICSGVHESRFTDFTRDIWTPRFRCIPAHRMHRKTPRFQEAQRGPGNSQWTCIVHTEVVFRRNFKKKNSKRRTLAQAISTSAVGFFSKQLRQNFLVAVILFLFRWH